MRAVRNRNVMLKYIHSYLFQQIGIGNIKFVNKPLPRHSVHYRYVDTSRKATRFRILQTKYSRAHQPRSNT